MRNDLIDAIKAGDRAKVEELIAVDPVLVTSADENGVSAVLTAIYYGQHDLANLLAEHSPTLTMHEGASLGDVPTICALGRWPDTITSYSPDGWTPLHLAVAFGGPDATAMLLELGAPVDQRSRNSLANTPLHACAAISGSPKIATILLDAGADVNARQAGDFTPLHAAAANGSVELVTLLVPRFRRPAIGQEPQ